MTYELVKKLKDAGYEFAFYPVNEDLRITEINDLHVNFLCENQKHKHVELSGSWYWVPTLSELIKACGMGFSTLYYGSGTEDGNLWHCGIVDRNRYLWDRCPQGHGKTIIEAVANLWLELNKGFHI